MPQINTCIPIEIAQSLKAAVESGEVSLMKLSKMSTEDRSAVFQKYLKDPELVKKLNTGFEARMNSETAGILRKYIIREMDKVPVKSKKDILDKLFSDTHTKKVMELEDAIKVALKAGEDTKKLEAQLNSAIKKRDSFKNLLNPTEAKPFLQDLAEQKLGMKLSPDEAGQLFKYADDAKKTKDEIAKIESTGKVLDNNDPLLNKYGLEDLALRKYTQSILMRNSETVEDMAKGVKYAEGAERVSKLSKLIIHTGTNVLGSVLKGALASIDNGVWGIQGAKTVLSSDLKVLNKNNAARFWATNVVQSWKDFISKGTWQGVAGIDDANLKKWINIDRGTPLMDRELIELFKSPNYRNGAYDADIGFYGLDILGRGEEAIPPSVLSGLPGYGRLHRVTEDLYNSSIIRLRRRAADELIETAKGLEMDVMNKAVAEELGEAASSFTGRGRFRGKARGLEASSEILNLTLFSARLLKSTIDTYWLPLRGVITGANNPPQRLVAKEAAKVWRGIFGIGATIWGTQQILGEEVIKIDLHPTSSTFGMVSFNGGKPIEIFGNNLSISRMVARVFSDKIYDPKLGVFKERKFYEDNWDALTQFITGKKSPLASFYTDIGRWEHFGGEPVTWTSFVEKYLIPITWQGVAEEGFAKNDWSSALIYLAFSGHGFQSKDLKWNPGSKDWKALKAADEKKYWEAVSELGAEMDVMIKEWRASDDYQEMTEEERAKFAEKALTAAQKSVIGNYSDFIPEE